MPVVGYIRKFEYLVPVLYPNHRLHQDTQHRRLETGGHRQEQGTADSSNKVPYHPGTMVPVQESCASFRREDRRAQTWIILNNYTSSIFNSQLQEKSRRTRPLSYARLCSRTDASSPVQWKRRKLDAHVVMSKPNGKAIAIALGAFCAMAFCAPAYLVSRGYTVAGDRQRESAADIAKVTASSVQQRGTR